ncbi:MAG TPA: STAS domain-containing protein [Acidimicrobiales bacterium]|nr:STAS domain-containing protein [Acidimicrobiales bacterium]
MPGEFFVRPVADATCTTVAVGGDVDTYTSPELVRALDEVVRAGASEVVVDVAEVTFIDSSGLAALIGGAKQARSHGASLKVTRADASVRRLFEIAGLNEILGVEPD